MGRARTGAMAKAARMNTTENLIRTMSNKEMLECLAINAKLISGGNENQLKKLWHESMILYPSAVAPESS